MRAQFVSEKFTEEGDPIKDMGIGMRNAIQDWLEEMDKNKEDTDSWKKFVDSDEDSIMFYAIRDHKNEFVHYLINEGDIKLDGSGTDFIKTCCNFKNPEALQLLIDAGHKINRKEFYLSDTVQMVKTSVDEENAIKCIKILFDKGVKANTKDAEAAVSHAARFKSLKMMKILVDAGASIHRKTDQGIEEEPLMWAALVNNLEIVKYLLDKGAKIYFEDCKAIKYAENNQNQKMVNLLKKRLEENDDKANLPKYLLIDSRSGQKMTFQAWIEYNHLSKKQALKKAMQGVNDMISEINKYQALRKEESNTEKRREYLESRIKAEDMLDYWINVLDAAAEYYGEEPYYINVDHPLIPYKLK